MSSLNKVILIGRLGADPEMRYLPSGDAVASIRLATSERSKDKNTGEMKELTEWHRVSFFGRQAEIVGEYLKKGSLAYIEGRIRTRKWQDQSGQDRYSTEIVADQMKMLGSRSDAGGGGGAGEGRFMRESTPERSNNQFSRSNAPSQPTASSMNTPAGGSFDDMDDDIPF